MPHINKYWITWIGKSVPTLIPIADIYYDAKSDSAETKMQIPSTLIRSSSVH